MNTSSWNDIVAVSAGDRYIIGLREDGTVMGDGHDLGDGQLNVSDWKNIVDIATGWRHTVGLDSEGELHITGFGSSRQLKQYINEKDDWTDIVAIAAGSGYTMGLKSDGSVITVGYDDEHKSTESNKWKNIMIHEEWRN